MKKQIIQAIPDKDSPERDSKLKAIMSVTEEDSQFVLNLAKTIFGENFSTNKPITFYNTFSNRNNNYSKSPSKLPQLRPDSLSKKKSNLHIHTYSGTGYTQNSSKTPPFGTFGKNYLARSYQDFSKEVGGKGENEGSVKGHFRESLYGQQNVSQDIIIDGDYVDSPQAKESRGEFQASNRLIHLKETSLNYGDDDGSTPIMKAMRKNNFKKPKKDFFFGSSRFPSEKLDQEELNRWLELETRKIVDNKKHGDVERWELVEETHKVAMEYYFKLVGKEPNPHLKFLHRLWMESRKNGSDIVAYFQKTIQAMEEKMKQEIANINYERDRKFEVNEKIVEHFKRENEELLERINRLKEYQNDLHKKLQEREREFEEYEVEKQVKEQEKRKRQIQKAKEREKNTSSNVATDTKGLIKLSDMFTQMSAYEFKKTKETQTDLLDIINQMENEAISPLKKDRRQKDKRILNKLLEIDKIDSNDPAPGKTESVEPNSVVDWDSFKKEVKEEERPQLQGDFFNGADWAKPMNLVFDKFSDKILKFLNGLELSFESLNNSLKGGEQDMTKVMYEDLLRNRSIFRDFVSIFEIRNNEINKEIMELRIEKAESLLKENEKNKLLGNLEKKYKKLNEKFKQIQETLLFEESISGGGSNFSSSGSKPKGPLFTHREEEEDEADSPDSPLRPNTKSGSKENSKADKQKPRRQSLMKLQSEVKGSGSENSKAPTSGLSGRNFLRGNSILAEENSKSKQIELPANLKKASPRENGVINKFKRRESLQIQPSSNSSANQGESKSTSTYLNEILYAKETDKNIITSTTDVLTKKTKIVAKFDNENHREIFKTFNKIKALPLTPSPEFKSDSLSKMIAAIYTENLKGDSIRNQFPLSIHLWEFISNKYGSFSKGVEAKILAILRSCLYYKAIPRVRLFYKLLGITTEPHEYDEKEFQLYLSILQALDEPASQHPGLAIAMIQSEKAFVPLKNVLEFFQQTYNMQSDGQPTVSLEYYLNSIKEQKEPHPVAKALFVVDVDFAAEKLMEMKQDIERHLYKTTFDSVQTNNSLELDGFLLLCRTLESKRFKLKQSLKAFAEYADLIDEDSGKKSLSFRAFVFLSQNCNFFSYKKVNAFMNSQIYSARLSSMGKEELLKKEWNLKKDIVKLKYLKGRMFSSYLMESAKSIDNFINSHDQKRKDYELNSVFMRFILLHLDSDTIFLNLELENYIPSEFQILKSIYEKV